MSLEDRIEELYEKTEDHPLDCECGDCEELSLLVGEWLLEDMEIV